MTEVSAKRKRQVAFDRSYERAEDAARIGKALRRKTAFDPHFPDPLAESLKQQPYMSTGERSTLQRRVPTRSRIYT